MADKTTTDTPGRIGHNSSAFCEEKSYEALLMDYAAGTLCLPLSSIVAAHLTLSPASREKVKAFETVGGAMLENNCDPVALSKNCLDQVMSRIMPRCAGQNSQSACTETKIGGITVPSSLKALIDCPIKKRSWKKLQDGFEIYTLRHDRHMRYMLMKLAPDVKMPPHNRKDLEITLVLEGAFEDETGRYERGDMIIMDGESQHAPRADASTGCVCLSGRAMPAKSKIWFGFLFIPFCRNSRA